MDNYLAKLPSTHQETLRELTLSIVEYFNPEKIYCFGYSRRSKITVGCFALQDQDEDHTHYHLLMITKSKTRIEHEAQDYVNKHFLSGTATILVHGIESITEAVALESRFFISAIRHGILLYTSDGLLLSLPLPEIDPQKTLAKTEKYFDYRYNAAIGFMEAAKNSLEKEFYNNAVFMLHQAVEQSCITLIKVHMAYRSDIHSLGRLLNLCTCFSSEIASVFPRVKEEEIRLFQILSKSYSEARYRDDFRVSREDAGTLCGLVDEFITLTEKLCRAQISSYRNVAEEVGYSLTDYHPALSASLLT